MTFSEIIERKINESNMNLSDISNLCDAEGVQVTVSYLSKLKNNKMPPPSENVIRVLAKVLNIDCELLIITSYLEKSPLEFKRFFKILSISIDFFKETK